MLARLTPSEGADCLFQESTRYFYQFLQKWEFNDYGQLLYLETGEGSCPIPTWQNFETLCCYFRVLRSLGFGDEQEVPLELLHSGCKLRDKDNQMMTVVNRHLHYAKPVHQEETASTGTSARDVETERSETLDADDQLSYVILNATSASAGDFFLSIKTRVQQFPKRKYHRNQNKIVREVGQCKFVRQNLTQELYEEERNKSAGPDDFFILYTTTQVSGNFELPDRSGLVDKSCWNSSFDPFAGRAYIASRHVGSKTK